MNLIISLRRNVYSFFTFLFFFISITTNAQIVCPNLTSDGIYKKETDIVISTYHSSVALTSSAVVTWGEDMSANGSDATVITEVSNSNGYNFTGSPIMVALSGNSDAQAFLLTTSGMYSWGAFTEVVGGAIVTSNSFSSMSLPSGVAPSDIKDIKANTGIFFLLTKLGEVYIAGQTISQYSSGSGSGTPNVWHQVQNTSTPGDYLTGAIELTGNREAVFILKSDNSIWGWGEGIPLGSPAASQTVSYPTEISTSGIPSGVTLSQISSYSEESGGSLSGSVGLLGLGSDGKVYGIGENGNGNIITSNGSWVNNWTAIAGPGGTGTLSNVVFLITSDNTEEYPSAGVIVNDGNPTNKAYVWGLNDTYSLGFNDSIVTIVQDPIYPGDFNPSIHDPAFLSMGGHATSFLNKSGSGSICFIGHITNGSNPSGTSDASVFFCFDPDSPNWPAGIELCINQLDNISPAASTIVANPTSITANSTSTSTITVQLYTASNVLVNTSSATIVIGTNKGSISSTTDNNDGTFTAILTSTSIEESATVTFTLDGTLSPNTATVTFTAGPDTTPPVISDQTFTYAENQAANYNIGDIVASDNSGTYTLTITSGNLNGYFALSSTGSLTLTATGAGAVASNDFETTPNSFPLEVTATDGASNTATGTITINVTDVDDTYPVILDQTFTYAENQAANYAIGTVSATDSNTLTYAFETGENTDGFFAINSSTGAITLTNTGSASSAASNDYVTTPNSFSLIVKVTDLASNTATGTITINVTEVDNTAPILVDQSFTYAESQAANYAIGTVSATDSNTLTYAFDTGENSDGFFAINSSTGAITLTNVGSTSSAASNDYETTPNSFSLVIKVTDPSSNTTTGTININVTDVSEITFGITPGQVFSYAENQAANYAIGTVTATDYIGGVTFSISSGNTAGHFALSSDGALTLTSAGAGAVASNDYETTPNSFSLGISVTDTTSTTVSGNVTINVTDIDEITDTDGDGVPDSIELSDGTDPTDGCSYVSSSVSLSPSIAWEALDCDADGLTNGEEKDLGTNPKNKDTDGDGVLDGTEVTDSTNPLNPCDYITASITEERTSQWLNADCDKDGLTNGEEIDLGTDPFDADTDGDGVLDGTEVTDGTNPLDVCDYVSAHITQVQKEAWLNADCDNDGLTNEKEKDLGTDPFNADTDGDGVLDGTEVSDGTDPLDLCDLILSHQTLNPSDEWNATDCDEDGLSNKEEKELGTDPKNPDTDGDGVLDGTEVLDGTDPLDLCDFILSHQTLNPSEEWNVADCDEDGLTNKEEKELGTDPKNPDTDGDGVLDGRELTDNTNPLDLCDFTLSSQSVEPSSDWNNADCDYDGAKNGIEIEYGSNPLDKDTDKDGVIDGTEITDNTDVLDNCSLILEHQTEMANILIWNQLDCDNDSLPNGGERREDSDNDGILNFLDSDDDNDGIPTKEEYPDANKNAFDEDAMDVNNNNIPDYLEANNFNPNEIDGIEVYNVLTPNGDGVHDIFTIRNISMYPDNEVRVYNRWGKLVYEMKGYGTNGRYFNGTSNLGAQRLSSGTYFYVLNYRDANAQNKTRQGYLYLNR
jgi:gliding motility-associated-like protein